MQREVTDDVRLRGALCVRPTRRTVGHWSTMPCRGDVSALLCQIDATVGGWEPNGKGTVDTLHLLVGRGWRPHDCSTLDDYCDQLGRWTLKAAEILIDSPRVYLHGVACPRCDARTADRDSSGERVRVPALRVSGMGCKCSA